MDPKVVSEMHRMRTSARLELCLPDVCKPNPSALSIVTLNTRSANRHMEDMRCDLNLCKADIICVQETWAVPSDDVDKYAWTGYDVARLDAPQPETHQTRWHGCMVYSRSCMHANALPSLSLPHIEVLPISFSHEGMAFLLFNVYLQGM